MSAAKARDPLIRLIPPHATYVGEMSAAECFSDKKAGIPLKKAKKLLQSLTPIHDELDMRREFLGGMHSAMEVEPGTDEMSNKELFALLKRRVTHPLKQWTFAVVFVVGILILGYLAVWIELKTALSFLPTPEESKVDLAPLQLAYATAILAVAGPSIMQLMLTLDKMAMLVGFVLIFLMGSCAYFVSTATPDWFSVQFFGVLGLITATTAWWLANGEDELFQDKTRPAAASGGDPTRELSGKPGKVKV